MRSAQRDAEFTEFVTARRPHLRRVAYALCGDWHLAEDILQTALAKLYAAWPRVVLDGREESYVRTILVRTHIDETRRPWRRETPVDSADLAPGAAAPGPDVEERSALFDALQQLPEMQRKVVVLRHWLCLSVTQTADELGVSEGTVKSHASRGRARLERLLTPSEVTAEP